MMFLSLNKALLAALVTSSVAAIPTASNSEISSRDGESSPGSVAPIDPTLVPGIVTDMLTAPTNADRFRALFSKDGKPLESEELRQRTVFDFDSNMMAGAGLATISNFPFLTKGGLSFAIGTMGPCQINIPHFHPRATEFFTLIKGTQVETGFILDSAYVDENGEPIETTATLGVNQGTVFPAGAMHYQFNAGCEEQTFAAALSGEDPGISVIATNFLSLDEKVVEGTLGITAKNLHMLEEHLPTSIAKIAGQCVRKCNL